MEWYYASNGQQLGPVSQEKLVELLLSGQVKPTDLVWASHLPTWVPLQQVPEITAAAQAAAPPAPQPAPPSAPAPEPQPVSTPESFPAQTAPTFQEPAAPEYQPQPQVPAHTQAPLQPAPPAPATEPAPAPSTPAIAAPAPASPAGTTVNSYLWQSIALTILCCLPLGIVALLSALKVGPALEAGDVPTAEAASASARKWCMIAFITGLLLNILFIGGWALWFFAMGGAQLFQQLP